jgi:hypothetical protein
MAASTARPALLGRASIALLATAWAMRACKRFGTVAGLAGYPVDLFFILGKVGCLLSEDCVPHALPAKEQGEFFAIFVCLGGFLGLAFERPKRLSPPQSRAEHSRLACGSLGDSVSAFQTCVLYVRLNARW